MSKQYSISELASEFDITTRTIRFYEEKALLSPMRKGTKRLYNQQDRVKLRLIIRGKRLGLTLEESKHIIDMYTPAGGNEQQLQALISQVRHKRSQLQEQLIDLENMISDLTDAEKNCMAELDKRATS
ncbi:MAG: DNA-binding transcriptional MerR regulator [Chitinophagales bacterium]|jgi:DNA-binding transcriptional MerR regulator